MMPKVVLACTLTLGCLVTSSDAHVSLLFPQPRVRNDFRDTVRTSGACGGTSRTNSAISVKANATMTVRWEQNYAHTGGSELQLLDKNDALVVSLGKWSDDYTRSSGSVKLPETACTECSIRLVYQAQEWGPTYLFYSCADVDVVATVANACGSAACMNGAVCGTGSVCQCAEPTSTCVGRQCATLKTWRGEFCEDKVECTKDSHCGTAGKCLLNEGLCMFANGGGSVDFSTFKSERVLVDKAAMKVESMATSTHIYYRITAGPTWAAIGIRPDSAVPGSANWPIQPGQANPPAHGMNNEDMVLAYADGAYSRVLDAWGISRAKPRPDEHLGGTDDVTDWIATTSAMNTVWTLARKRTATDATMDHGVEEVVTFVWAVGQGPTNYPKPPPSPSTMTAGEFYCKNCVKYHGGSNRGKLTNVALVSGATSPTGTGGTGGTGNPNTTSFSPPVHSIAPIALLGLALRCLASRS